MKAAEVEARAALRVLPDAAVPATPFNASMACGQDIEHIARTGDWVEVPGSAGSPGRRGQIIELLGGPGREHFQVRWDEHHESMVFPGPGVRIVSAQKPALVTRPARLRR